MVQKPASALPLGVPALLHHQRRWGGVSRLARANGLFIAFLLVVSSSQPLAAAWPQTAKLLASDADADALDGLGYVVASDGNRIAVATPWDDEVTPDAGATYVFERDADGRWLEAAKLTAPDAEGCCWYLGTSVGISGDTLVAAAPGADPVGFTGRGAAYVFQRDASGVWSPARKLKAPDVQGEAWATSVAIDGDFIAVGAVTDDDGGMSAGAVYVFERDAGGTDRWGPVAKLTVSDADSNDNLGWSVAVDGDRLVAGARNDDDRGSNAGGAYVFDRGAEGGWTEAAKLTASDGDSADLFGWSVGVGGDTVVVGAYADEDGGNESGAAYVFERDPEGVWTESTKLAPSDAAIGDWFGRSVGINGGVVVAGAKNKDDGAGAAYVFERAYDGPGLWGQVAKLTAADREMFDNFGYSVAISDHWIVAGSPGDDDSAFDAGAAYVFVRVEPRLSAAGACPGTVTLALTAATPNRQVALFWGTRAGSTPVPTGRCAGTELGLADPVVLSVRPAGPDGDLSLVRTLGAGVCDRLLQVLDGTTCQVSAVLELPAGD